VKDSYGAGVSDEFIKPVVVGGYPGMKDGDGVLMANFRADRARQILEALLDSKFAGFPRSRTVKFAAALGLVEYSEHLNQFLQTMFPPEKLTSILGEIIAGAGLTQLRIAETEKYAHVTFFFNGGREEPFKGEERILIPSPKVATYDLKPEMSAPEVTEKLVKAIASGAFDFIVVNYANTDMVGHTGIENAAQTAVEAVDAALGKVWAAVKKQGGVLLITADHGNAEQMLDLATREPHTQHTLNPVPLILAGKEGKLENGRLCDVAPTVLSILGLPQPKEMTGRSLVAASV
jgi:2,3-bisphosphoglycerate-independent phosphoglycerate mutase